MADFKKLKDGQGNSYNVKDEQARTNLASHTSNTSNPHSVTKAQVGLGNVDNTSDANKPISNAQAAVNATKFDKANVKATPASTPSDDNVVSEKYSEETYGKKDGNYPTMTVGAADNLTPYDESAGDDQDEPFSFQATGTANGTQSDFATGSYCQLKEKRGNSVVVNQHITDATTSQSWTIDNSAGGSAVYASHSFNFASDKSALLDHYYIVIAQGTWSVTGDGVALLYINNVNHQGTVFNFKTGVKTNLVKITSVQNPSATTQFLTQVGAGTTLTFNGTIKCVDITQWYGSNSSIPSDLLTHDSNFFRYYQGSLAYNAGQIVNANSRYIKCIGRNQWDEEWEVGTINFDTGVNEPSSSRIRSKNYIPVTPNAVYHMQGGYAAGRVCFYDANKNHISSDGTIYNSEFNIPANACFMKFSPPNNYGTTYNHDITISLYYEGESGYNEYYPYEVLTNNDTGTEELKSAGNVADSKTPDGTVNKVIGSVDLGTLNWAYASQYSLMYATISDKKDNSNNLIISQGNIVPQSTGYSAMQNGDCRAEYYGTPKDIIYKTTETDPATFKTAMNGVILYFELATPTTEQGTPFSENLVIDDFGSMEFSGTSGVPQGNLIFYPVDYKAFIDTLYDYTEGTPSDIQLKSDLNTAITTFLTGITGYDATKTQVLKNIEGTLTWVDEEA